ncbi:hypothetical protein Py04_1569 [Pyrococcus sp. ST04]|nr:hypothetical protein Py04_1569 [Pyrococcus sp. ST04]
MMYRPPLYPYTLSLFFHFINDPLFQLKVARIISAVFFAMTATLTYKFAGEIFEGKNVEGILATLFFIFNGLALTMGGRELVHSEFTFFYTLAVYLFYTGRKLKKPKRIYGAFISAGLAILTRYTGLSIVGVFLAYLWIIDDLKWVRKKEYLIGFFLLFLTLLPWLYMGHLYYGGFLRPFEIANRVVTLDKPTSVVQFLSLLIEDVGIVLPVLAVFGLLLLEKDEKGWLLISWVLVGFGMIMMVIHKETRFITFLSPALGILVAYFIHKASLLINFFRRDKIKQEVIAIVLGIILLIPIAQAGFSLKNRWNSFGVYDSEVLLFASKNYPASSILVSPSLYTMAGFYYPGAKVDMILNKEAVRDKILNGYYEVVIYKGEGPYLNLVKERYKLVKEFYGGKFKVFIKD